MDKFIKLDVAMGTIAKIIEHTKDKKAKEVLLQVGDAIMDCPTEDVVPRSEVERLEWELSREREYIEFLKVNIVSGKQEVAREVIGEFKSLVINYVKDRDLLLVAFKNAVAHAENELKKKYIGE